MGKKTTLKPIGGRVLLKLEQSELEKQAQKLNLVIEDTKKEIVLGTVIEVGEEVTQVQQGDRVMFSLFNADPVEDYFVCDIDSVLLKFG